MWWLTFVGPRGPTESGLNVTKVGMYGEGLLNILSRNLVTEPEEKMSMKSLLNLL